MNDYENYMSLAREKLKAGQKNDSWTEHAVLVAEAQVYATLALAWASRWPKAPS